MQSLPRLLGASDLPQVIPTRSEDVAYQPIRKTKKERLRKCGEGRYLRTLLSTGAIILPPGCWRYLRQNLLRRAVAWAGIQERGEE